MKTIEARSASKNYRTGQIAWIWTDAGDGKLYPVEYYRHSDGWVVCRYGINESALNTLSFCVCPDSPCYLFDSDAERLEAEQSMRRNLAERRERWSREESERIERRKAERIREDAALAELIESRKIKTKRP